MVVSRRSAARRPRGKEIIADGSIRALKMWRELDESCWQPVLYTKPFRGGNVTNLQRVSAGKAILGALLAAFCSSCASGPDLPMALKVEKPFAAAGSVEMQLDGGDYRILPASGDRIRVSFGGNIGNARADVTTAGAHANLSVKDTPHSNFKATIELPQTTDLVVRLTAGNLEMAAITGDKDIDSKAGNVEIAVGNSSDYSSVDASVTVGNLEGGPFGKADSGLARHLIWSGPGKYKLRASLGAGNLELKSK